MEEHWLRIVENLFARLGGPLHFRIILQPLMAVIFAIIDGVKDARTGKPPYFRAIFFDFGQRKEHIKNGWKSVGKIFIIAVILDIVYQLKVIHRIYPGETLIVALVLAFIPYFVLRGPVNRVVRMFMPNKRHNA
jgi:hypothetical protein